MPGRLPSRPRWRFATPAPVGRTNTIAGVGASTLIHCGYGLTALADVWKQFLADATSTGRALIDRELYLPRSWVADPDRCREAAVPEEIEFATKAVLAQRMLGRALDAGVPAGWVAADEAYGQDHKFRTWCERRRIGYVVASGPRRTRSDSTSTRSAATTPGTRHITLAMLAHAYLALTAAITPKDLATASFRSPSAKSAVCWHT